MKYSGCYPIVGKEIISETVFKFTFKAPEIAREAKPGQFIQIKGSESYFPLWPRPFSIHDVDTGRGHLEIMLRIYGSGSGQIAVKKEGDNIRLFGPLGNGFELLERDKTAVLVAGGVGLPPLYFWARKSLEDSAPKRKVIFIAGARTRSEMLEEKNLDNLDVALIRCTDDGSVGQKGTAVDILSEVLKENKDCLVHACGPNSMLRKVDILVTQKRLTGFLSLEALMPCGYGICSGCAVMIRPAPDRGPTDDNRDYHLKRVCVEGPVFKCGEVIWP